jgi:drug/metabolite transporter (DMT)-like permease
VSRARLSELSLIGIAAVWGLTFPMVQDAVEELPTMPFLGYRFLAAALVVAIVFRRSLVRLSREGWIAGAVMGVFVTGGYVFQTFGLERTTSSNAGFITGLFVVITPLLAALVLRERIGSIAWAAAAVSGAGLFLLSGTEGFNTGDALVLLCAILFSAHILATGRAAATHETGALLVVQLAVCGIFCTSVAGASGELEVPRGGDVWLALAVTAFVASALGFFVQTYAQKYASPERTALILASEPAFAGLFGYLLADERLSALAWSGAVLIMAAILVVELLPRLRPPRPLPEG